jgi:hypothetical protein
VNPKITAARVEMVPVTRGRLAVRFISASMSRSMTQLSVLAAPADNVPPTRVARTNHPDGMPRSARTMTGTVVMSSSSMIRGLVRATYWPTTKPKPRPVDPGCEASSARGSTVVTVGESTGGVTPAGTGPRCRSPLD